MEKRHRPYNLSVSHPEHHEHGQNRREWLTQEDNRVHELATKLFGRLGPGRSQSWEVIRDRLFPVGITFGAERFVYERPTRGRDMTKKVLHRVNMDPDGTVNSVSSRDLASREDLPPDDPLRQIPEKYFR